MQPDELTQIQCLWTCGPLFRIRLSFLLLAILCTHHHPWIESTTLASAIRRSLPSLDAKGGNMLGSGTFGRPLRDAELDQSPLHRRPYRTEPPCAYSTGGQRHHPIPDIGNFAMEEKNHHEARVGHCELTEVCYPWVASVSPPETPDLALVRSSGPAPFTLYRSGGV